MLKEAIKQLKKKYKDRQFKIYISEGYDSIYGYSNMSTRIYVAKDWPNPENEAFTFYGGSTLQEALNKALK